MNLTETTKLVALVKMVAPAQKFEEFTADAWQGILEDISLQDAIQAVKAVAKRLAFIAPSDLIAEVKIIHRERLKNSEATFVPPKEIEGESERDYAIRTIEAQREHIRQLVKERPEISTQELPVGFNPKQLENVFKRPPGAEKRRIQPEQILPASPRTRALMRKRLEKSS